MGMFEYGIGGNEVKIDASEAIADIPFNRTLLVDLLTANEPLHPEKVEKLETPEQVFEHFKPNMNVVFENEDGQETIENFQFHNVADFLVKNMTKTSPFLKDLDDKKTFFNKVSKQLRSNKILQKALQNGDSMAAFIEALEFCIAELDAHEVKEELV